jgi:ElaB/YqjD/DUF883 family membrane-anchored ribosome-binding protein
MATTADMAPSRTAAARARGARKSNTSGSRSEADLQKQIDELQADIKAIAGTLQKVGNEKVSEAQGRAKQEYKHLLQRGQSVMEEVQDEFGEVEKQIKDTIRQKPLTAVISAVGIGFLLAILTR